MSDRRRWLALGLTLAVAVLWYASTLFRTAHPSDENAYFQGFALSLGGASPYGAPRFVYLPIFARAGALAVGLFGERATTLVIRLVNLIAACILVRQSVALTSLGERAKTWLGLAAIIGFRPFLQSFEVGNLSPVAAAATVGALTLAVRRPVAAGLVLAAGCAVKPAGLGALAVLLAYGSGADARKARVAAAIAALAIAATLAVDAHWLRELFSRSSDLSEASTNLSLQGIIAGLGIHVSWLPVTVFALLACAEWMYARRALRRSRPAHESDSLSLVAIGCLASLYSAPRVWVHSFTMVVPAVVVAVAHAAARVKGAFFAGTAAPASLAADAKPRATAMAMWVILAVACIAVGDAWGELGSLVPGFPFAHSVGAAIPLAATAFLTQTAMLAARRSCSAPPTGTP